MNMVLAFILMAVSIVIGVTIVNGVYKFFHIIIYNRKSKIVWICLTTGVVFGILATIFGLAPKKDDDNIAAAATLQDIVAKESPEVIRRELVDLKNTFISIKDGLLIRKEKISPFYDDNKLCLNCGEAHTDTVQTCKSCGAINSSGIIEGNPFRRFILENTDVYLFGHGTINVLQKASNGYEIRYKIDKNENFYSFYSNSNFDCLSDMFVIPKDTTPAFISPMKNGNIDPNRPTCLIRDDGSVVFCKYNDDGLNGLVETINAGGSVTREIYKNGTKTSDKTNQTYLPVVYFKDIETTNS